MNTSSTLPVTNSKGAYYLTLICFTFGLVFYAVGGKELIDQNHRLERTRDAIADIQRQDAQTSFTLTSLESTVEQMQGLVDASPATQQELATLKERLHKLESALQELGEFSEALRNQTNEAAARQDRARSLAREADRLERHVRQQLVKLEAGLIAWTELTEELLNEDNDRGRQLAGDAEAVRRMALLLEEPAPTLDDCRSWTAQLDDLKQRIDLALSDPREATRISTADVDWLNRMQDRLGEEVKAVATRQRGLQQLLPDRTAWDRHGETSFVFAQIADERTEDDGEPEASGDSQIEPSLTLQEALDAEKDRQARALLEQIDAEVTRRVQVELDRRADLLAEERVRHEQEKTKRALEEARAQTLAERARAEALKATNDDFVTGLEALLLQQAFEREFDGMKAALTPFLSRGLAQPQAANGSQPASFHRNGPNGPMSLGGIAAAGALETSDEGLEVLYFVGGYTGNLRLNIGGFPRYQSGGLASAQTRRTVEEVQSFLRKYGDLMVDKHLLSE